MSVNGVDFNLQESFKGGICSSKDSEGNCDIERLETEEVYSFTLVWEIKKCVDVLYLKYSFTSPQFRLKSYFSSVWYFDLSIVENFHMFTVTLRCQDVPEEFKDNNVDLNMSIRKGNLMLATDYQCKRFHSLEEVGFSLVACAPKIDAEDMGKSSDEDLIVECNLTFHDFRDTKVREACDSLSADFLQLLESRDFSDFELRVGNLTFPVHKVVLWTRAKKLAEHFGISQPSTSSFNVTDVDVDVLKALLHFLYSGEVTTQNESCFAELLKIGEIFEIRDLKIYFFVRKIVAQTFSRTERIRFRWPILTELVFSEKVLEYRFDSSKFSFVFTFQFIDDYPLIHMRKILNAENPDQQKNARTNVFASIDAVNERNFLRIVQVSDVEVGEIERSLYLQRNLTDVFEDDFEDDSLIDFLLDDVLTLDALLIVGDGEMIEKQHSEKNVQVTPTNTKILKGLNSDWCSLRKNAQQFSDLTLRVAEREIPAHRAVLSLRSPVFGRMFHHEMAEARTGIVNVLDVDFDTLNHFLDYLYSANVTHADLHYDALVALYSCADKYECVDLREQCADLLEERFLTKEHALQLMLLADTYMDARLKAIIEHFICMNSEEILGSDEWRDFAMKRKDLASAIIVNSKKFTRAIRSSKKLKKSF